MKIHEFQGKAILSRYGVPIPEGRAGVQRRRGAGCRGAARRRRRGRQSADSRRRPRQGRRRQGREDRRPRPRHLAKQMLGMTLVTHQTGPEGRVVKRVLVEQGLQMTRELYLGIVHRSLDQQASADGEPGRRHGDRESRRRDAGSHFQGVHRSGARPAAVPGAAARVHARPVGEQSARPRD